jgi:hypothetical protein
MKLAFGILMVLVYVGIGAMLAFYNPFGINRIAGIIIGVLMVIYGIFRGIRLYRSL